MSKTFWKSKVFWLNLLAIINELLKLTSSVPTVPTEIALPSLAAANIGLRSVTKVPVTLTEKSNE